MGITRKANGFRSDRTEFSDMARFQFFSLVGPCRQTLELPLGSIRGIRFNDDWNVFFRLESAYSEAEFLTRPHEAVNDALLDAASADHWYEREKVWGFDVD